jgi:hypothetical protein
MTWALVPFWFKCVPTQIESARLGNKKSRRGTDHSRIRWRLGWHGGVPLQPRGSVPPSFDGFTLGSVLLVNHVTPHATRRLACMHRVL